jgi:Flp pilus assembly protein TadD
MSLSLDASIASVWKGDELFEKGDFEGAIGCYDKALEIFPRDPDLWNERGLALNELRRYEEAIKSYNTALGHYPRETIVWNNKGVPSIIRQTCRSY